MTTPKFTVEDIEACWPYALDYLANILNMDYKVENAIEDLCSLVGSKYDLRVRKEEKF